MRVPLGLLFDVDNTLLDNDRFKADLGDWLPDRVGAAGAHAYWQAFDARRERLGYVDFLGAVQDCRDAAMRAGDDAQHWFEVGDFLLDYPFSDRLFAGVAALLAHMGRVWGPVWLISDGDAVMQPHKLRRAGLWDMVGGRVRIFVHKEKRLTQIACACPADHHVFVDDKPAILHAVKAEWGDRVTTILPRQGHYAQSTDADLSGIDLVIDHIGALGEDARFAALLARHATGKENP